jgi:hypothetical protein
MIERGLRERNILNTQQQQAVVVLVCRYKLNFEYQRFGISALGSFEGKKFNQRQKQKRKLESANL